MEYKRKAFILGSIIIFSSIGIIFTFWIWNQISTGDSVFNLEVKVGMYENEPKVYENENGEVVGLFPDILKQIAASEGWKIEWVKGTWTECLNRLENGSIDIMVDVAYSEERELLYDFNSVEVINNWGIIYAKGGSSISSIDELDGKKIAVMTGSIHTEGENGIKNLVKKWNINCEFIEVEDYDNVFEELDKGNADAGVVNRIFGLFNEKDHNVARTSIMFNPSRLLFAFHKNAEINQIIIPKIDEHLLAMKEDTGSSYYQLIDLYLYGQATGTVPQWIFWLLAFSFGLVGIFISSSYMLRRMVNNRTMELKQAHNELEIKVEERTRELSDANERLKGLDELKSMFIANMSHELRTPLTSIIGFTRTVLKGWAGDINEEQEKQLTIVLNSANHLLSLINDIIDVSKIETGKLDIQKSKFKIIDIIEDLLNSLKIQTEKKGLNINVSGDKIIEIFCDEKRIRQILMNLIGNAIKFTDKGIIGIKVFIRDDNYLISVEDTGMGIKEENIVKLFKPFSRIIDPGQYREGTGLGLHLSKRLANLLGGDITVNSVYGKGSIFTLILKQKMCEVPK